MLNPVYIEARDLGDAWFQSIDAVVNKGRCWTVQQGSYEGQKRYELDFVTVRISHPETRPLVPDMPQHMGDVPPPTTIEYIENDYLPYLMTAEVKKGETYTYGSRLADQIEVVIERLRQSPGTNQCSMSIAQPSDINLVDPPCLRELDCRLFSSEGLQEGEKPALHFITYWRSWDAYNGFPANLAGLQYLKEYMATEIGVASGETIAASKGLHVYGHALPLALQRVR